MTLDEAFRILTESGVDGPVLVARQTHLLVPQAGVHHLVEQVQMGTCELICVTEKGLVAQVPQPGDWVYFAAPQQTPEAAFSRLVAVVDRLLGPGGCPWDIEQTHSSLKRYLLEEAYELMDAIDSGDNDRMREELGDLLLQPLMHSQMERRDGAWGIEEVAQGIADKLVRRHPHVFGDTEVADSAEVLRNWDAIKKQESGKADSILAGVPRAMAALLRAHEVSKRAARVGFEWPNLIAVFDKLGEERRELQEAVASGNAESIESEIGDLLFTVVNIARWLKVEPEEALRKMLDRFTDRFQAMESAAEMPLRDLTPEQWDELWRLAKSEESKKTSV